MAREPDHERLAAVVTRLRRALRRGVRPAVPHEALPVAQVEVLQYLAESPGLRASDLTERMLLAPTTVSTLVGQLLDRRLVERRPDRADRRVWHLHLTDSGLAELTLWQQATTGLLRPALKGLPTADRRAIRAALPALERLVGRLDPAASPMDRA